MAVNWKDEATSSEWEREASRDHTVEGVHAS